MSSMKHSFRMLFGQDPVKPDPSEFSEKAAKIHADQAGRRTKDEVNHIRHEREIHSKKPQKWRRRRWAVLLIANLLFALSYGMDIQILEGALTGSRFVGFHLADLNSALQVMLAFKHVLINLLIGTVTVFILWWFLGGRSFCSWVCPYHLIAEWAEMIHVKLAKKGWVKDHAFDRRTRSWLWVIFAVLAFVTGYTIFETISLTGILSRALIYGPGLALLWVGVVLLFEILYSRRAWCRYACPIGLTYGLVGATSPMKVEYTLSKCFHDGACRKVCLVPHVLDVTKVKRATEAIVDLSADCTRCGRCVDVCPTQALNFKFKGLGL
jgi:ferredoxin-type protein NapH